MFLIKLCHYKHNIWRHITILADFSQALYCTTPIIFQITWKLGLEFEKAYEFGSCVLDKKRIVVQTFLLLRDNRVIGCDKIIKLIRAIFGFFEKKLFEKPNFGQMQSNVTNTTTTNGEFLYFWNQDKIKNEVILKEYKKFRKF